MNKREKAIKYCMLLFKINRESAIKYLGNIKSVIVCPTHLPEQYINSALHKYYAEQI